MTTSEMLSHVRMQLDEDSAGYWTDAQIYTSLTNGQLRLASDLLNGGKEQLLHPLLKTSNSNYNQLSIPSDYLSFISCRVGTTNVKMRTGSIRAKESNYFLAGSSIDPFVYLRGEYFVFSPTLTSGTYDMDYYKTPTDIDGSTEPILQDITHPIVCQYAFADLLLRDEKFQESVLEFSKYEKMVAKL